eukprot:350700-Chlamydomonas_euryale.AAC.1
MACMETFLEWWSPACTRVDVQFSTRQQDHSRGRHPRHAARQLLRHAHAAGARGAHAADAVVCVRFVRVRQHRRAAEFDGRGACQPAGAGGLPGAEESGCGGVGGPLNSTVEERVNPLVLGDCQVQKKAGVGVWRGR